MNHRKLRTGQARNGHRVEQDRVGRHAQRLDRDTHGLEARTENVAGIDVSSVDDADADGERNLPNPNVEMFPRFAVEAFGIIQAGKQASFGKDHRGRHDRSGERAPSRFVDAGD